MRARNGGPCGDCRAGGGRRGGRCGPLRRGKLGVGAGVLTGVTVWLCCVAAAGATSGWGLASPGPYSTVEHTAAVVQVTSFDSPDPGTGTVASLEVLVAPQQHGGRVSTVLVDGEPPLATAVFRPADDGGEAAAPPRGVWVYVFPRPTPGPFAVQLVPGPEADAGARMTVTLARVVRALSDCEVSRSETQVDVDVSPVALPPALAVESRVIEAAEGRAAVLRVGTAAVAAGDGPRASLAVYLASRSASCSGLSVSMAAVPLSSQSVLGGRCGYVLGRGSIVAPRVLQVSAPRHWSGVVTLDLVAVTTEAANGAQANTTIPITVVMKPVSDLPIVRVAARRLVEVPQGLPVTIDVERIATPDTDGSETLTAAVLASVSPVPVAGGSTVSGVSSVLVNSVAVAADASAAHRFPIPATLPFTLEVVPVPPASGPAVLRIEVTATDASAPPKVSYVDVELHVAAATPVLRVTDVVNNWGSSGWFEATVTAGVRGSDGLGNVPIVGATVRSVVSGALGSLQLPGLLSGLLGLVGGIFNIPVETAFPGPGDGHTQQVRVRGNRPLLSFAQTVEVVVEVAVSRGSPAYSAVEEVVIGVGLLPTLGLEASEIVAPEGAAGVVNINSLDRASGTSGLSAFVRTVAPTLCGDIVVRVAGAPVSPGADCSFALPATAPLAVEVLPAVASFSGDLLLEVVAGNILPKSGVVAETAVPLVMHVLPVSNTPLLAILQELDNPLATPMEVLEGTPAQLVVDTLASSDPDNSEVVSLVVQAGAAAASGVGAVAVAGVLVVPTLLGGGRREFALTPLPGTTEVGNVTVIPAPGFSGQMVFDLVAAAVDVAGTAIASPATTVIPVAIAVLPVATPALVDVTLLQEFAWESRSPMGLNVTARTQDVDGSESLGALRVRALPPAAPLSRVTVNGDDAAASDDGWFTLPFPPTSGASLLVDAWPATLFRGLLHVEVAVETVESGVAGIARAAASVVGTVLPVPGSDQAPTLVSAVQAFSAFHTVLSFSGPTSNAGANGDNAAAIAALTSCTDFLEPATAALFGNGTFTTVADLPAPLTTLNIREPLANGPACTWLAPDKLLVLEGPGASAITGGLVSLLPGAITSVVGSPLLTGVATLLRGRPLSPDILSARFMDSGAGVVVALTAGARSILQGLAVRCDVLFANAHALGSGSGCVWTSDSGLELTFGSGATLVPAPPSRRLLLGCDPLSTLQLLPLGVLSALLSCVPVAAPLAPVLPAPVVAAPQVVGVCDLLSLDAGQSTGSGGRAMTFTWSILGAVATASNAAVAPGLALPSSALTGVQAALALATTTSQSAVAIPPSALPADAVLEVAVSVTNYLAPLNPVALILNITRAAVALPRLLLDGPSYRVARSASGIVLRASAVPGLCALPPGKIKYTWEVVASTPTPLDASWPAGLTLVPGFVATPLVLSNPVIAAAQSTDSRLLHIPAHVLRPGDQHVIRVTAALEANPSVANSAAVAVTVLPDAIQARLAGGDRTGVSLDRPLVLDASPSYDPDQVPGLAMSYSFTCTMRRLTGSAALPNAFAFTEAWTTLAGVGVAEPCTSAGGAPLLPLFTNTTADGSVRELASEHLRPNVVLTFGLTVTVGHGNAVPLQRRESSTSVSLSFSSGLPPVVSVPSGTRVVNTGDVVKLTAAVEAADSASLTTTWSLEAGVVDYARLGVGFVDLANALNGLSDALLTPERLSQLSRLAVFASPVTAGPTVSLTQYSLVPGATYAFRFAATDKGGTATGTVTLRVNAPPSGGHVVVSTPGAAVGYNVSVEARAMDWVDTTAEDLPLRYAFGYLPVNITQYAAQLLSTQDQLSAQAAQEATTIALLASGSAVSTVNPGFGGGRVHSVFVPSSRPLTAEFLLTSRMEAIIPLTPTQHATIIAFVQDSFGAVACSCVTDSGAPAIVAIPATSPASKADASLAATELVEGALVQAEDLGDTTAVLGLVSVASSILQATGDPSRVSCSPYSAPLSPAGLPPPSLCGRHGVCDTSSGSCVCLDSWAGPTCELPPVPVNGGLSVWSEWSPCSASCGGGVRTRTRTCTAPAPQHGGLTCAAQSLGHMSETEVCGLDSCLGPVAGGYSGWGTWSECTSQCPSEVSGYFPGVQRRTRTCTNPAPSASPPGAPCDGPAIDERPCNTEWCPGPPLRCPGTVTVAATQVPCSGHGTCARAPATCTASTPGCAAWCVCDSGYSGSACDTPVADLAERRSARASLANATLRTVQVMEATPQAVLAGATAVAEVVGDGDELTFDVAETLLDALTTLAARVTKYDGQVSDGYLGADACSALIKSVGSIVHKAVGGTVGCVSGFCDEAASVSLLVRAQAIVHSLPSLAVAQGLDEAPMAVTTSVLSLASRKVGAGLPQQQDGRAAGELLVPAPGDVLRPTPGAGQRIVLPDGVLTPPSGQDAVVTVAMQWNVNPHAWYPVQAPGAAALLGPALAGLAGGVTTVQVQDATSGAEISVSVPAGSFVTVYTPVAEDLLEVAQGLVAPGVALPDVVCRYWDEAAKTWSGKGVVLSGLVPVDGAPSYRYAECLSSHLSDYGSGFRIGEVTFNTINVVDDAGLLVHYANTEQLAPLLVLCALVVILATGGLISVILKRRDAAMMEEEMKAQFLESGSVASHEFSLHLSSQDIEASSQISSPSSRKPPAQQLGDDFTVNTAGNVWRLIMKEFAFRLKRDHMWTGICTANRAGRVRLSRPQRIVILSAQIFTSLAVGAFLFSTEPFRVTRLLQTGAMSSAVAFPLGILLPLMFRKANHFRSRTIVLRSHAAVSLIQDTMQSLRQVGFVHNRAALHMSFRNAMRRSLDRVSSRLPRTQMAANIMVSKDSLGSDELASAELATAANLDMLSPSGVDAATRSGPPARAAPSKVDLQVRASSPVAKRGPRPNVRTTATPVGHGPEASNRDPFDTNLCLPFDGRPGGRLGEILADAKEEKTGGGAIATSPKRTPAPVHHDDSPIFQQAPARGGAGRDYSTHMHHLTPAAWKSGRRGDQSARSETSSGSSQEGPRRSLASLVVAVLHMALQFCGVMAMGLAAIFHTSADAALETQTSTAAIVGIAGAMMLVMSALGHLASRASTVLAWILAVPSAASFGLMCFLLLTNRPAHAIAALAILGVVLVLSAIGVGGVLVLTLRVSDNITRHIKAQQLHHQHFHPLKHVNAAAKGHVPETAEEEQERREVLMAAMVMRRALQGFNAKRKAERRREYSAWTAVKAERRALLALMHIMIGIYITFMVYLCLLHGVKFNADVARGWVEAGLLSFCFSCVVTATGMQFVKSVIAICIALVKRHKMERVSTPVLPFKPEDGELATVMEKPGRPRSLALGENAVSPPPLMLAVLREGDAGEQPSKAPARYRFQTTTGGEPAVRTEHAGGHGNPQQPRHQEQQRALQRMMDNSAADDGGPPSGGHASEYSGSWFHAIQEAEEVDSSGPESGPRSGGRDRHNRSLGSIFRTASGASRARPSHRRRGSSRRTAMPPGLMDSQASLGGSYGAHSSRASGGYDALHLNASQDTIVTVATAASPTQSRGGSRASGNYRNGFHQPSIMPLAELSSLNLASETLDDMAAEQSDGADSHAGDEQGGPAGRV